MAEELQLTQPTQEVGALQQRQEWATSRALELQMKKIVQDASAIEAELASTEQGQFEPNRLLHKVVKLHQSTEDLLLDVGACVEQRNQYHPQQHAPNIRRGAPVQRNPSAAHTNQTAATDNGGALPLQDQVLGGQDGLNGDFIGIHQDNQRPGQSISPGGETTDLPATTDLAPIASPSVRSATPAPGNFLVSGKPPTVRPTPAPEANKPSKPQPAVHSDLRHNYAPREGQELEAEALDHDEQHGTQPQSWPPTNRAATGSSAAQLPFMTPVASGPRAMIHLEGEHFPRLQAEEPD
ncbi:hypothetical protein Bbelb_150780 [Branchiostoma belcheri]|nr:hypothetical protein Bbelb_150780 [Branchiostoma belcheri]